ncbi:hypothetical protein [Nocardia abscessus]|uniref:hypothetical protein n=1 Tax=Nocardia abscessus TaxID=120957 RepID=UPI002454C78C|nr:hypothetical protein [Nocardia abscessus]
MVTVTVEALPDAYALWQERLVLAFFKGRSGQPVVMFVDSGELQHLADEGEDGAHSLASAVRSVVDVSYGTSMFARAKRLAARWRRGDRTEPPPTLPILALSVLAASEMRSHGGIFRHNYYMPLVRVLLPDESEETIESARYCLRERGAFLDVVDMWEELDRWLKEWGGEYGISTIGVGQEQPRIGYPLSQTLLRRSDRAALTQFFATLDLRMQGVPSAESLLRMLRLWVSRRGHGLTDRFVESLDDDDLVPILAPLLHDLAVAWDGNIITSEGLRRLELRLALDLDDVRAWWVVPAVRDIAGDILTGVDAGAPFEVMITADPHSTIYKAEGLPDVTANALTAGLVARGEKCVAEFQPTKMLALAEDTDVGGWRSVDVVQPYEGHVFVVATDVAAAVSQALRSAADVGWRTLDPPYCARLLGSGFAVFSQVVFSDQERLDSALAALPGSVAAGMRRGVAIRPKLINGLPIVRSLARNVYLPGGEPDLVLPVGAEPRDVDVTLDGQAGRIRASLFPFPFCRLGGGYSDGTHTVEADEETLTFVVERGAIDDRAPINVGRIGWVDGKLQKLAEGVEGICGAVVPGADIKRPVLARRGSGETVLIGADGHVTKVSDPPSPSCLPELPYLYFEVPTGEAVWLAQKRLTGWSITKLRGREPSFRGLSIEERLLWDELYSSVQSENVLWRLYARAWEHYRAR